MLKKRLVGAVTIKNSMVVQSFGYNRYLPIGKPKVVVENLDRWGVDEIFIQVIDRSSDNLGPDMEMIEEIASSGILTPIMYAGGIQNEVQAAQVIRAGAERICVDALLHINPGEVEKIANRLGGQAMVGCLPVSLDNNGMPYWYNYQTKEQCLINDHLLSLIQDGLISEILLVDWQNEGFDNSFDFRILELFEKYNVSLVLFGGLSSAQILKKAFDHPMVVAAAVGNRLNYSEHSIQKLKNQLSSSPIRTAYYHDRSIFRYYD
jgi:imidazole glycerol-phosphate synthase subunit HisF